MTAGPEEIALAVARLRAGGLVAFPTETVYGLGADALSPAAIRRVFELKGRPPANPLIVHVADVEMARMVAAQWPVRARALAAAFWPGPLTIVVPKAERVPDAVTAGGPTVGVRCPDHAVTLALLAAFGSPLVGPSANPSGRVSPTTAAHVRASFGESDVMVLDGGPCRAGIESTVVSVAEDAVRVYRSGPIGAAEIEQVLGCPVETPTGAGAGPAPSPGMLGAHYAPRTRAALFEGDSWRREAASAGGPVAVLSARRLEVPEPHTLILMPEDAEPYAARLYAALREADELGASLILVERPPSGGAFWVAIGDRLSRAAGAHGG